MNEIFKSFLTFQNGTGESELKCRSLIVFFGACCPGPGISKSNLPDQLAKMRPRVKALRFTGVGGGGVILELNEINII